MADLAFTADETEQANNSTLGAEYFAARAVAERFMPQFEEKHFKPLIDRFVDDFRDRLWDDVKDWLLTDTEYNLHSSMAHMVEASVEALLTGEEWAMRRYPLTDYTRGEKVRKAIAEHCGDEIQKKRIADLEKEVARLTESLRFREGRY